MPKKSIQKDRLEELAEAIIGRNSASARDILMSILPANQLVLPGMNLRLDRTYQMKLEATLREIARKCEIPEKIFLSALGRHHEYFAIVEAMASSSPSVSLSALEAQPFLHIIPSKPLRYYSAIEVWQKKRGGEWLLEPKFDGWECQIHISDGQVNVYSHAGNIINEYVPNICKAALEFLGGRAIILEGELVAVDPKTRGLLPSRYVCKESSYHQVVVFDVMFFDHDFTHTLCMERRKTLEKIFQGMPEEDIYLISQVYADNWENFHSAIDQWTSQGMEGAIGKRPWVKYEANMRTSNRIKIKFKDTVDAVVLGYRDDVETFLAALIDRYGDLKPFAWVPLNGEIKSCLHKISDTEIMPIKMGGRVTNVQVKPEMVVEIQGEHIYPLASSESKDDSGQGWSLFSPTVKRIREDKSIMDATTVNEFLRLPVVSGYSKPDVQQE